MNTTLNTLPDLTRPGVGTVMSSEWTVHTPERQRTTVETLVDVWTEAPWPEGLYSYSFYLGTDGSTLLHYSQWKDDQAYKDFVQSDRKPRVDRIDAAVPGIGRHDLAFYRLYRSLASPGGEQRSRPGVIVTEFIDAEGIEDARRLADGLAAAREGAWPPGLVSAGLHVSSDGRRVLDYSEWTSENAFDQFLSTEPGGAGARRIKRFQPYRSLTGR